MDVRTLNAVVEAIRSVSKRTQTMAIQPGSLLVEDLALDSLDLVGVLMALEDRHAMKIDLDDVPNVRTVSDVGSLLESLLAGRSAAA